MAAAFRLICPRHALFSATVRVFTSGAMQHKRVAPSAGVRDGTVVQLLHHAKPIGAR